LIVLGVLKKPFPELFCCHGFLLANKFQSTAFFIRVWSLLTDPARSGKAKVGSIEAFVDPPAPQGLQLLVQRRSALTSAAPVGPHAVPPQQAVLILGEAGERHVEDPLLRPAGFGCEGEDLGG
jgi:hypothetical protein